MCPHQAVVAVGAMLVKDAHSRTTVVLLVEVAIARGAKSIALVYPNTTRPL